MRRASKALLVATLTLGAAVACSPASPDLSPSTERFVCGRDDVPERFLPLVSGDYTSKNLAELARRPEQREQLLQDAGLVGGAFSYWKEAVDDAARTRPANVLCEALEFETPEGARAYIRGIDPRRDGDLPGLAWLPSAPAVVSELDANEGSNRTLVVEDPENGRRLVAMYTAQGNHVIAVYVGGPQSGDHEEQARDIQSRLLQRVSVRADSR